MKKDKLSIRKQGIKKLITGAIAFIPISYFVHWADVSGIRPSIFFLICLGAPIAWGLTGLLEIAMNRPFSEMESWWGLLAGWQRGMLGIVIVVLAFAILIFAIAAAGYLGLI